MNDLAPILDHLAPGDVQSVPGVAADCYHALPCVSQSLLKEFGEQPTPAHFQARAPRVATAAMQLGTVLHSLVLEPANLASHYRRPDTYEAEVKGKPVVKPWHGGADWCKDWLATHSDRPVITGEEETALGMMRSAVMALPVFAGLLAIGQAERSWFKRDADTGLLLKCRTDLIATDAAQATWICDLKKVRRGGASETEFAKTCVDFGYHVQAAYYLDLTGATRFLFCAVEDEAPFAANLIELDAEAIALGRVTYRRHLSAYAACVAAGQWPGYTPGIKRVNLPAWAYKPQP